MVKEELRPTSRRVGICVVQLESNAFDKITEVICTSNLVRIGHRRGAPDRDSPPMGVVRKRRRLSLLLGQDSRSISINDWSVYAHTLQR